MLSPTYLHPGAEAYRAPGGAWDHPSLDVLLSEPARVTTRPLVVDGEVRLGGTELDRRVGAAAGALRSLGVGPGSVVAWQLPNSWRAVVFLRACWRLGAVAAPLHHLAGATDVQAALAALRPDLVLAPDAGTLHTAAQAQRYAVEGDWDAMLGAAAVDELWGDPFSLAAVLFTSGSSGTPKGVMHTQASLAYKARLMVRTHGLGPADVVLMPAPCAHISGVLNGVTLPGAAAMTSVLMAKWDPQRALELIEHERVTFMIGPPTFFVSLMNTPDFTPQRVAGLRLISSGGAGVTAAFCADASARLGARVKRTYGSTEAPTIATGTSADTDADLHAHDGRALGAAELSVHDPDSGAEVPTGARGELWLRGPELCSGYLDVAQSAAAFTADGWFRTGDLATIDEAGWLTVVGRLKDVIIRGGENIDAAEVEAVLEAHPAVRQACAVGFPDALMGERVCAFVVTDGGFGLEECRAWFAERGVATYKTPERVVTLAELPLLGTGKPDRAALATRAAGTGIDGSEPAA